MESNSPYNQRLTEMETKVNDTDVNKNETPKKLDGTPDSDIDLTQEVILCLTNINMTRFKTPSPRWKTVAKMTNNENVDWLTRLNEVSLIICDEVITMSTHPATSSPSEQISITPITKCRTSIKGKETLSKSLKINSRRKNKQKIRRKSTDSVNSNTSETTRKQSRNFGEEVDEFYIDDSFPRFLDDEHVDHGALQLLGNVALENSDDQTEGAADDEKSNTLLEDFDKRLKSVDKGMQERIARSLPSVNNQCICHEKPLMKDVAVQVMSEIMETKQMEEMAVENSSETGENIIVRVAGLPMVNSAIGQVSSMYTKTKEWNGLVKYTLETAEKSVATIAGTAMPVVNKLEKPINLANYYACTTMDKLEEACPIINQPTDKIVSSVVDGTKTAWDNTKKAGSDKINYMMQNRVVQAFTGTMDATLSLSEKVVDSYLPPEPTENEEYEKEKATEDAANSEKEIIPDAEEVGGESAVARVVNLSGKVRHRVYARAMSKLRNAQKRSRETLDNLKFTVNLIDYAKENIDSTNQKVKDQVTSAQDKLWSTWNDWTTEDGEQSSIADEQEQEQKTLAVARDLAKRLKIACGKVTSASLKILPDSMMTQVTKAKNFTDELYDSFKNAKVFNDLPSSLLTQAKDGLNQVSDMMMSVTEYAVNSRALQWLVPSKVKQALTSGGYDVILESIPPNPDDALDSDDEDDEDDDEDDDDDEIDIDDEFHTNEVVMSQ